jgi:hypothetical protein
MGWNEERKYTLGNLAHTAIVSGTIIGMLLTKFDNLGFQIGNFNAVRGAEPPYMIEITYPKQGFGIMIKYEAKDQISEMAISEPDVEDGSLFDPYIEGCRWKAQQVMYEVNAQTGGKVSER